jgi:SAM-dependent methyltransferase
MDHDFQSSLSSVLRIFPCIENDVAGKVVVDYGCGRGGLSLDLAKIAQIVYAVDIRPELNALSGRSNIITGLPEIVPSSSVDALISLNAFEHYSEPKKILLHWRRILKPDGRVYLSFGPPWYHPYGAHVQFITRLPWIHLWCPERVVMTWRSFYKKDGARRYEEVEGGLNRMSIRKCDQLLAEAGFRTISSRNISIKGIDWPLRFVIGRELWTSNVERILCPDKKLLEAEGIRATRA